MATRRLLIKHKKFLFELYPNCDITQILEELDYTQDDLDDWRNNIKKFEKSYLEAIDLTKSQERFLKTYRKKMCNIAATCRGTNIARSTYYEWLNKSDTFKKEVDIVKESLYDDVETKMYNEVFVKDNPSMMMFIAKTQMKHRGYVESTINTNLNVNTDKYADKSLEEIQAEIDEMEANGKE